MESFLWYVISVLCEVTRLCSYLSRKSPSTPSAPSCGSLPPEALPWLVTAEETSLSSAGAGEVGMAHRSAAAERVGPPEVSARGWWEGWAAGPACSQLERVKAQMGEGTKAPFSFLRVRAETIQGRLSVHGPSCLPLRVLYQEDGWLSYLDF